MREELAVIFPPDPIDALLIFAALAVCGIWLVVRGIRGHTADWVGTRAAARSTYIVLGLLAQAPAVWYLIFLLRLRLG